MCGFKLDRVDKNDADDEVEKKGEILSRRRQTNKTVLYYKHFLLYLNFIFSSPLFLNTIATFALFCYVKQISGGSDQEPVVEGIAGAGNPYGTPVDVSEQGGSESGQQCSTAEQHFHIFRHHATGQSE